MATEPVAPNELHFWGTLNTYGHVLPALQEDGASKMDAILSKA